VLSVSDFNLKELEGIDLLVVGSPIIAWKPSEKMGEFLAGLSNSQLKDIKVAVFDTRVKKELKRAGAEISTKPQAFFVKGKEGPLFEGEVDKAIEWTKSIKTLFTG